MWRWHHLAEKLLVNSGSDRREGHALAGKMKLNPVSPNASEMMRLLHFCVDLFILSPCLPFIYHVEALTFTGCQADYSQVGVWLETSADYHVGKMCFLPVLQTATVDCGLKLCISNLSLPYNILHTEERLVLMRPITYTLIILINGGSGLSNFVLLCGSHSSSAKPFLLSRETRQNKAGNNKLTVSA